MNGSAPQAVPAWISARPVSARLFVLGGLCVQTGFFVHHLGLLAWAWDARASSELLGLLLEPPTVLRAVFWLWFSGAAVIVMLLAEFTDRLLMACTLAVALGYLALVGVPLWEASLDAPQTASLLTSRLAATQAGIPVLASLVLLACGLSLVPLRSAFHWALTGVKLGEQQQVHLGATSLAVLNVTLAALCILGYSGGAPLPFGN